jgi:beta-N-acetylhexosaminidase
VSRTWRQRIGFVVACLVAVGAGVGLALGAGGGGDGGGGATVVTVATVAAPATTATLSVPAPVAAERLFLVGFAGTSARDRGVKALADHDWAGVVLEGHNATSSRQVRALAAAIKRQAPEEAPIVGIVQPGGEASALPDLPPLAQQDVSVAREAGHTATQAAEALTGLGIELTLAPVADLAYPTGPMASAGYSADPQVASDLVGAAVAAYREGRLASAPGAFPGQGAASQDPSQGPGTVGFSLDELKAADLLPFDAAAAAGAPAIQMSNAVYAAWDGVTPATLAPEAYDLLRRGTSFGGVAISADLQATTAVTGTSVARAAVEALRAGADLLWVPGDAADQDAAVAAVARAIERDPALRTRAAEALGRVDLLRARYEPA